MVFQKAFSEFGIDVLVIEWCGPERSLSASVVTKVRELESNNSPLLSVLQKKRFLKKKKKQQTITTYSLLTDVHQDVEILTNQKMTVFNYGNMN